jgi:hypothetical protein
MRAVGLSGSPDRIVVRAMRNQAFAIQRHPLPGVFASVFGNPM